MMAKNSELFTLSPRRTSLVVLQVDALPGQVLAILERYQESIKYRLKAICQVDMLISID